MGAKKIGPAVVSAVKICIISTRMIIPFNTGSVSITIVGVSIYQWCKYFRAEGGVFNNPVILIVEIIGQAPEIDASHARHIEA